MVVVVAFVVVVVVFVVVAFVVVVVAFVVVALFLVHVSLFVVVVLVVAFVDDDDADQKKNRTCDNLLGKSVFLSPRLAFHL